MMHSKNLSRVCSLKYRLPTLLYIAYSVYSVEQISQYVCPPLKMPYPGRDMLYPTVSHSTPCYTLLCYALHYNTVSHCVLIYSLLSSLLLLSAILYRTVSYSTPCWTLLCYDLHYTTVSHCVLLYSLLSSLLLFSAILYHTVSYFTICLTLILYATLFYAAYNFAYFFLSGCTEPSVTDS